MTDKAPVLLLVVAQALAVLAVIELTTCGLVAWFAPWSATWPALVFWLVRGAAYGVAAEGLVRLRPWRGFALTYALLAFILALQASPWAPYTGGQRGRVRFAWIALAVVAASQLVVAWRRRARAASS